jgi:hypothetical protein
VRGFNFLLPKKSAILYHIILVEYLKISLLLAILFAFGDHCFSQKITVHAFIENKKDAYESDTVYYDFNRNLKWSDFKGMPLDNYFAGAVTASGFAFDSKMIFDGKTMYLNIGVYAFFSKKDSWKKPEVNFEYHLLHEQHHFDITRIGAEYLIDEIRRAHFTKANYDAQLNSLFDKAYKKNTEVQHEYDRETNHSINVHKQLQWNNKIAIAIFKLKQSLALKN